jgi:hypothetical protein
MFGSLMTLASGCLHQLAEFGQVVRLLLGVGQILREIRQDTAGQGNVLGADGQIPRLW